MSKLNSKNIENSIHSLPVLDCKILSLLANQIYNIDEKVDAENYQLLFWKCMTYFIDYFETKNREFVSIFIEFVDIAKTCNEVNESKEDKNETQEISESMLENEIDDIEQEIEKQFTVNNT